MTNKKCGVYKITNDVTGKFYIGSSIDINKRWKTHIHASKNPKYNHLELYKDFNEYGIDSFTFEIIEECTAEERHDKEYEYIKEYQAVEIGYNAQGLEKHPNHKLTIDEVKDIRTRYDNHEDKNSVYFDYEDKINYTGFHKIWHGYTWKNIMPEVFTEENKQWHYTHGQSRPGSQNGMVKITEDDVKIIRARKRNGETRSAVFNDYKQVMKQGGFDSIWYGTTWKHII